MSVILPHPSASPLLPSWASRPEASITHRVSFPEQVKSVIGWLCGREPDWRQRVKEARIVDALAAEMEPEPTDAKAR